MIKLLNTNSFLNKIAVQEASLGKFICPECSTFFTNSKTEYEDHLREKHIDYDQVSCIYCAVSFDFSKISNHIESHFEENLMSTNICNLCNTSVKMDSQESILNHLMDQHNNEMICPLCKMEYSQFCDLVEHINDNLKIVYHCTFEGCQMKTNDNEELNFHKNISGHISDSCFEEHTFNCMSKDEESQFSFIRKMDNDFPLIDESQLAIRDSDQDFSSKRENDSDEKVKFNFIWQVKCRFELFSELFKNLDEKGQTALKKRLNTTEMYSVGILLKDDKKFYGCLECNYAPQLSHWDVKKHIMTVHCQISPKDARRGLRLLEFDKQKLKRFGTRTKLKLTKSPDSQKALSSDNKTKLITDTKETESDRSKFDFVLKLHFVKELVTQCFADSKTMENSEELQTKLSSLDQYSIGVSVTNNKKTFFCSACNYTSNYSPCDVRKHILIFHCSLSNHDARKSFPMVHFIDSRTSVKIKTSDKIKELSIYFRKSGDDRKTEPLSRTPGQVKKFTENQTADSSGERKSKLTYILKLFCRIEMFDSIFKGVSERICLDLKRRLAQIDQYTIGVSVIDRSKKIYYCLSCDYVSNYSNWDVRKHILKLHLGVTNSDSHKCIKMVEFTQEDASSEMLPVVPESPSPVESDGPVDSTTSGLEPLPGTERETPFLSGEGTLVKLDYIREEMTSVFPKLKQPVLADLERKMELFKTFSLEITYIKAVKHFVCIYCGYKSHHNQGDVKKHIMSKHCLINGQYIRDCMRLCRKELLENSITTNHNQPSPTHSHQEQQQQTSAFATEKHEPLPTSSGSSAAIDVMEIKGIGKRKRKPVVNRLSLPVVTQSKSDRDCQQDNNIKTARNYREEYVKRKSTAATVVSSTSIDVVADEQVEVVPKKPRLSLPSMVTEPRKILIEKQINLRYSERILKLLCGAELVGHRLEELRAQMNVYCQSQVRVGRKFNSPIFICSSCNWFTWKSVGLVSRHVMETHAAIDSVLMPLAELSAKMDDSGQLMSDEELSQLDWRGRPVWSLNSSPFVDLS